MNQRKELSNSPDRLRVSGTTCPSIHQILPTVQVQTSYTVLKHVVNDRLSIRLSHDYLKISLAGALEYKYSDKRPVNQSRLGLRWAAAPGTSIDVRINHEKSRGRKSVSVVDAGLNKSLGNYELYLQIKNLFNRRYEDVAGVPMPGLSAAIGIRWGRR